MYTMQVRYWLHKLVHVHVYMYIIDRIMHKVLKYIFMHILLMLLDGVYIINFLYMMLTELIVNTKVFLQS